MELDLQDKVAVVTGGGGAICGAIVCELVREGARVSVWDLSLSRAETTARAAGEERAMAVRCDATDRRQVCDGQTSVCRPVPPQVSVLLYSIPVSEHPSSGI